MRKSSLRSRFTKNGSKSPVSNISLIYGVVVTILLINSYMFCGNSNGIEAGSGQTTSLRSKDSVVYSEIPLVLDAAIPYRQCSAEQAALQGENLAGAKVRGCPPEDDIWIRLVHSMLPHAKVFIDIGSNKGYTAVRFFSLWNPELGLTAPGFHKVVREMGDRQLRECGACADCNDLTGPLVDYQQRLCSEDSRSTADPNAQRMLRKAVDNLCGIKKAKFSPIRVFSFDGNDELVKGVNKAIDQLASSGIPKTKSNPGAGNYVPEHLPSNTGQAIRDGWSVELSAFTAACKPGETLSFVQEGELGHIGEDQRSKKNPSARKVFVPCTTVDQMAERENLQHIDILKIDTEGHDVAVLEGATELLKAKRVTVILFEYNTFWPAMRNGQFALKSVTEELAANGYICYLEGKNTLLRLTTCWHDNFGAPKWSNIYCISSSSPQGIGLVNVFDTYSLAFNV